MREIGVVSLAEALALTALVVQKEPHRRSAFTLRWLRRLLNEDPNLTIDEAVLAASALACLGGRSHERTYATLSAVVERATSRQQRRGIDSGRA